MFEAAVVKFTRAVGQGVYHPVPSLASGKYCRLGEVVVKKKSKWFFVRDRYEPTELQLRDILTSNGGGDSFEVPTDEPSDLVTYNKSCVLKISGEFAASFKEMFEAELDGVDSVSLEANLGLVKRQDALLAPLLAALENKSVNMQHELLQEIASKKRRSLCIVVGVAQTAQASCVKAKLNFDIKASAEILTSKLSNKDEISSDSERSLDLPAGTTLAYKIVELKIGKTGGIRVVLSDDGRGGFATGGTDVADGPNKTAECNGDGLPEAVGKALEGFSTMSRDRRQSLGRAMQHHLPDFALLQQLAITLKKAVASGKLLSQDAAKTSSPAMSSALLNQLEAALTEVQSAESSALLQSAYALVRSAAQLGDAVREMLSTADLGDAQLGGRLLAGILKANAAVGDGSAADIEIVLRSCCDNAPVTATGCASQPLVNSGSTTVGTAEGRCTELHAAYFVVAGLFIYLN